MKEHSIYRIYKEHHISLTLYKFSRVWRMLIFINIFRTGSNVSDPLIKMNLWQLTWLSLMLGCALARPPSHSETVDTVRAITNAEDSDISKKIRNAQWEVDAEREMSVGLFDLFGRNSRQRRSCEFHKWLTEQQRQEIRRMKSSNATPLEIKEKIMEFFEQLPPETKETWNAKYKNQCAEWIKKVASEEEIAELEKLRENKDFDTLHAKLAEYKTRLSDEDRANVDLWKDVCSKLWQLDIKEKALRRLRRELSQYREYLQWMSDKQYKSLENLKEEGASTEQLHAKVKEYFSELPAERQETIKGEFKKKCVSWIKEVANEEQIEQLKTLHEKGDMAAVNTKIESYLKKLSAPRQEKITKLRALCNEAWGVSVPSRSRREIDAVYKEWIGWMTDSQKSELESMRAAGSSFDEIHEKISGYFGQLEAGRRNELVKEYKDKCRSYFSSLSGEDELKQITELYESGEYEKVKEIVDAVIERQPDDKRKYARNLRKVCYEVYHKAKQSKTRRDIDALMDKHLTWLTYEQRAEIKRLKQDGGSTDDIKAKLMIFLRSLGEEEQKTATEKTKHSCYGWLREVATDEEIDELERLHQWDHAACKKKVREYIQRLSPEKQEAVNRDLAICEQIWYDHHQHNWHHLRRRGLKKGSSSSEDSNERDGRHRSGQHSMKSERVRRGESPQHTMEHYIKTYLSWLTEEQKEKLKEMKEAGKTKAEIQHEVMHYYDQLHGEEKQQATEKLKVGCKMLLKGIIGEEKVAELRNMKEAGADFEELQQKVEKMLSEVTDEKKKEKVHEYGPACKKIFGATIQQHHRRRRHHFTLESNLNTHLKWLSQEQKDELLKMKKDGKSKKDLQAKILHYYDDLEGDAKKEATEHLKDGCREILKHVVGEEKAAELKNLKDSGASKEELTAKVEQAIHAVTDEEKKQYIADFGPACKKIYGVHTSRRRRHHFTLESNLNTHLKWLSQEQKDELLKMKKDGKSKKDLQAKILHYYDDLEGDAKKEATEHLKDGCREILKHVVGEEKAAELKNLKDSGASKEELTAKVEQAIHAVTDEEKKQYIADFGPACKKIYGAHTSRRRRHHFTLESNLNTHLKWLSQEQKDELLKMKKDGKSKKDLQAKILHYYDDLEGDAKKEATEHLKDGCREILKHVVGEEKAAELKNLKDSGASKEELTAKVEQAIHAVTDEEKKQYIADFGPACKKIYGVHPSRRRRYHAEDETGYAYQISW
uniref:Polyprotein allergen nematode domain-containing protein n=3 Tax=Parascaris TaxID=6254 RepID=A0A915CAI1_PARUN